MMYFFTGTDREKARAAMQSEITRAAKKATITRITDANTLDDLKTALQGGGMFGGERVLVLEGVMTNEDMYPTLLAALPTISESGTVFWYEEKPLADVRRKIEKYAEKSVRFDAPKAERDTSIFSLANALRRGDKKALWVGYQTALAKGSAPEAIHGILFWGAKQAFLGARGEKERERAETIVATLAELPHEARRHSTEFEYMLERYLLSF